MTTILENVLRLAAFGQICLAILNFNIVRVMGWKDEVARMPLLVREVFHVHTWFISITLGIFAALTWRFAGVMAAGGDPVARWVAAGIGIFWAVRAVLQITYYSHSHWRGIVSRTIAHVVLLVNYTAWAALYLAAGWR